MATENRFIELDARTLRGIAHPLRVRALGLLRRHGPATATQLAERMGQSSGALSYHLRQLAAYGFVVEDDERGNGRERWWKAAHETTRFDSDQVLTGDGDEATVAAGIEYLRAVARAHAEKVVQAADSLDTLVDEVGADAARTLDFSNWTLRLTPARASELGDAVHEILDRYRDEQDDGAADAVTFTVQLQVLPQGDA